MTTMTPLLLITADPSHPLAHLALRYARAYLTNAANNKDINDNVTLDNITLNVFLWRCGAYGQWFTLAVGGSN